MITFCKIQVILIDKYVVVYADKVLNNIVLITLHRKEIRWWHFHSLGNLIYIRFHNVHIVQIDLQRTDQLIVDIVKKKNTKKQIENRTTTCRSHITETIPNDKGQLICRFRNWNIKNAIYMDKISQAFTDKFIEIIKIVFSKKKLQSDLMTHFEEK